MSTIPNSESIRNADESVTTESELQLQIGEIPATSRRLWIRGRVTVPEDAARRRGWFSSWWTRKKKNAPPQTARLESLISNQTLEADVQLSTDGFFEGSFVEDLPPARRSWRVARNKLTIGEYVTEKCGVVLHAPSEATQAIVVVLPLAATMGEGGLSSLADSEQAPRVATILSGLCGKSNPRCPVYYLGCASPEAENRQQETTLAITSMRWPYGSVILLPGDAAIGNDQLQHGIDRLRWLFAGTLDLVLINLEPGIEGSLSGATMPREDRANVTQVIHPEEEAALEGPPLSAVRPTRQHRLTRYPVVFCHGMLAMSAMRMRLPENLNYFLTLEPFLEERGIRTLYPQVSATGSVKDRAAQLKEQILRWTNEPVNLIAHSMGGLDCRYMITHLDMAEQVKSLTTIATPHHGTYIAEWFIKNYRHRFPLLLALEALGMSIEGFHACKRDICAVFNEETPNREEVKYFSFTGETLPSAISPILRRAWTILNAVEGPNDGMVSRESAQWGECLGAIHADHFSQSPDSVMLRHPANGFDALGFYEKLVDDLAWRGF